MEIAIFAKKRTNKEGKPFTSYLSSLTRKDGTTQTISVKFREECGSPKAEKCPMNVIIDRGDANMVKKSFEREDTGETGISYTLWVSAWKEGIPYVDTSLDEFDV